MQPVAGLNPPGSPSVVSGFTVQEVACKFFVEFSSVLDGQRVGERFTSDIAYNICCNVQAEKSR
jgi:hypothetical protein